MCDNDPNSNPNKTYNQAMIVCINRKELQLQ